MALLLVPTLLPQLVLTKLILISFFLFIPHRFVLRTQMIIFGICLQVLEKLSKNHGDVYSERNVMISGTHTHSTPGGFLMHLIFDLNTLGFVPETFNALVRGIVMVS